jgi:hypothetical protein
MASFITAKDVFDFMGTDQGQRNKHSNTVQNLIERKTESLELMLRRKITTQTASSIVIYHGNGCEVYGDELFLKGSYRDFYSITALSETGTSLTESTTYNDGNDYIPDYGKGLIKRVDDSWSKEINAFTISGSYGYLNSSNTARKEVQDILIEMVAAASGLWSVHYKTEQGTGTKIRYTITKQTEKKINDHKNYSF